MATPNFTVGSIGGEDQIDVIDLGAIVALGIFAPMIFEVFSFQVEVFGGYDFTQALWTVGGADISPAFLITLLSMAWVLVTNLVNGQTEHEPIEFAIITVALASPVLFVLMPAFEALVMWHDTTQVAFMLYVLGATAYTSYRA